MLELPEAAVIANQISQTLTGKVVSSVEANQSPHKFAWFHGDPGDYDRQLSGRTVRGAASRGGLLEVELDEMRLVCGDGVSPRVFAPQQPRPAKHQLLVEFTDGTSLTASVQMYGGIWAFPVGTFTNPYYLIAGTKPSPLSEQFDWEHFTSLLTDDTRRKSAKAFLATEQRIPGLGNGVLQDILWNARISPRRPTDTLDESELTTLYQALKQTLQQMTSGGGRDTEKDLFGQPGGYATRLSKLTGSYPCPACGGSIRKEAYLGGSVYYCPTCQR